MERRKEGILAPLLASIYSAPSPTSHDVVIDDNHREEDSWLTVERQPVPIFEISPEMRSWLVRRDGILAFNAALNHAGLGLVLVAKRDIGVADEDLSLPGIPFCDED